MRTKSCLLIILGIALTSPTPLLAEDLDEDGVDDDLERMLIDRHRPHLYYDRSEDTWPSSVLWFVQRSELVWQGDSTVIVPRSELEANPLKLLEGTIDAICITHYEYKPPKWILV